MRYKQQANRETHYEYRPEQFLARL